MGYKYILFDLDGTITDPKEGIINSIAYSLDFYGVKVDNKETLAKYIGPPLIDTFRDGFGFDEVKAYEAVDKYREYFSKKGIFENIVYDGIKDMLKKLQSEGKVMFLATSKPWVYAEKILEHFELSEYISFVSGSELDGTRNKKNEVIEFALKKITELENGNLVKEDVVMVGDRKYDILGAKDMDLESVGVLYGYGGYEELTNANVVVSSVEELYDVLK